VPARAARERLTAALTRLGPLYPLETAAPAVSGVQAVAENALAARLNCGAGSLACALSVVLPGQWTVTGGGVVWVNGREVVYLVDWHQLPRVQEARGAAADLGCPVTSWTPGGVARKLLAWVGARQPHRRGQDHWLKALPWAYTRVEPGPAGESSLYDLESAYYAALCRLPSPHLDWLAGGPCWHPLNPAQEARWRALLGRVEPCKPLRLCLVGCMRGGGDSWVTYHQGQRLALRRQSGPLPTAALTVVRAVYELTALAAEAAGAKLANTDSVLLPQGERPRAWETYGYRYREVATGPAEVCSLAVYRVGDRQTVYYGQGSRFSFGPVRSPYPDRLSLAAWH
jgi:hypothetical protein